ncbi:cyclophilin-like fold protein [Paenibacillus sp. P46E]|uniref:cyclophilin-like fold protein n=1 Tax=Paenibacillus sp. P46E TaxID=1349436 RepID=UPI000A44846A|nr:cyclophilin-like fold protein [Paenibacillus sp. P46E]
MEKLLAVPFAVLLIVILAACSNGNGVVGEAIQSTAGALAETSEGALVHDDNPMRVASDGARIQTDDPSIPTRVLEGGTKINMHFGDVVIPGTLNDSITAQDLISKLPYTVHVNRFSHDFCGVMDDPLEYSEEDVHFGWLNGDIDFATDANYFTILFEDEEKSEQYGYQVNIGKINSKLSVISELKGSYDVLIELAD